METYIVEVVIAALALVGTLVGSLLANNKHQAVMQEQLKGVKMISICCQQELTSITAL